MNIFLTGMCHERIAFITDEGVDISTKKINEHETLCNCKGLQSLHLNSYEFGTH